MLGAVNINIKNPKPIPIETYVLIMKLDKNPKEDYKVAILFLHCGNFLGHSKKESKPDANCYYAYPRKTISQQRNTWFGKQTGQQKREMNG